MSILTVPTDWDLPTLNTFIAQQENFLRGPLVAINSRDDATILEIDDQTTDKPEKNSVVTTGAPPAGARVVASTEIYIRGTPVAVIAYRP
jgi:hypothetical protein